jgi:hypothetical protein
VNRLISFGPGTVVISTFLKNISLLLLNSIVDF